MGDRIADLVASGMGSWTFIIALTIFIVAWIVLNVVGVVYHWDPAPFILLNLLFSAQATYSAPLILMSQGRQSDRDREQAQHDYDTNVAAKEEIEALVIRLEALEEQKIDKMMAWMGVLLRDAIERHEEEVSVPRRSLR